MAARSPGARISRGPFSLEVYLRLPSTVYAKQRLLVCSRTSGFYRCPRLHHPDGPSEVFWSKIKKIQKNLGCFAGAKTSRVYRQVFITFMANKTCKTFRFLKMS